MRNSIIIIIGTPKSGISILGQCLRMLGLISIDDQAQTDISAIHELLFQDLDHSPIMAGPLPRGWMQTPGAERARQRINALIASGRNETNSFFIADPFLCRFMSLWAKAFQEVGLTPRFVLIVRHPWEAAPSLARAANIELANAHLLWLAHVWENLRACQDQGSVLVAFDQLLADPVSTLMRMGTELGLTWPKDPWLVLSSLLDYIQPNLKQHHISNLPDKDKQAFQAYERLYQEIRRGQWPGIASGHSADLDSLPTPAAILPIQSPATVGLDLVESLLEVVGHYEKQEGSRQVGMERIAPKPGPPLFVQVVFPSILKAGKTVETISLIPDKWQKITLPVPNPELLEKKTIHIAPLNTNGTVLLSGIRIVSTAAAGVVWQAKSSMDYDKFAFKGPVLRVPDLDNLLLIITGKGSFLELPLLQNVLNVPLHTEFWIMPSKQQNIIQRVGKRSIDVLLPIYEKAENSPSVFRKLIKESELINLLNESLFGGVSTCIYYSKTKVLHISGWFLPVTNYDTIEFYDYKNGSLGKAKFRFSRSDIFKEFHFFNERNSGWLFEKVIKDSDNIKSILVKVKNRNHIIKSIKLSPRIENDGIHAISNDICKKAKMAKKLVPSLSEVNIEYHNQTVFRVKNDIHSHIEKLIDKYNVEDLLENIKVNFIYNNKNKVVYSSIPELEPIIDKQLVDEICFYCDDKDIKFHKNYMLGNYSRIFYDAEIICKYIHKEKKILDIGSLPPLLPAMLRKKGFSNITVIDPNAALFRRYFDKIGARFINDSILENDVCAINETFDFVSICEVFEHLSGNMLKTINNICSFVQNDGHLYITTPNLKSISGLFGLGVFESGLASKFTDTVKMQYDRFQESSYFGHVREYTEKEIKDLFYEFGFEHIKSFYQSDYRKRENYWSKVIYLLENLFPEYRLFAKYLFKKINEHNITLKK